MNIAIVDDLASDRLQLIGKLQTYMQQARIPFTLYEFDSGEARHFPLGGSPSCFWIFIWVE